MRRSLAQPPFPRCSGHAGRSLLTAIAVCAGFLCVARPIALGAASGETAHSDSQLADHDHSSHAHDHSHPTHDHSHAADDGHASVKDLNAIRRLLWVLAGYTVLIACSSWFGGALAVSFRFSHLQFQRLLSIVGGMLLGIALFHLLPHAVFELGPQRIDFAVNWMMAGILVMFFLLRSFHVHHHEPASIIDAVAEEHEDPQESDSATSIIHGQHSGECPGHDHHHGAHGSLSWGGMFLGLGIHTVLDGVALGAAMQSDIGHIPGSWLGLGVLLGIVLHKPLDSLSITTMMVNAKQPNRRCVLVNLVYSLLCPLGALLFLLGVWSTGMQTSLVVGGGLAFSAGIFLCIALADLLPEMEFHSHNRYQLSAWLLFGVALAWAIRFLEPAHLHH